VSNTGPSAIQSAGITKTSEAIRLRLTKLPAGRFVRSIFPLSRLISVLEGPTS
jgi:hypothetical protein